MLGSGRSRDLEGSGDPDPTEWRQGLVSPVPKEWCHLGLHQSQRPHFLASTAYGEHSFSTEFYKTLRPHQGLRRHQPCSDLELHFRPLDLGESKFLALKQPSILYFAMTALADKTNNLIHAYACRLRVLVRSSS